MSSYAVKTENPRAPRRLLSHCALVGRALKRRVPARRRLERALGREQAIMLIRALTGDQSLVRRGRPVRRVKSSP
jgi:hypothetical protein